MALPIVALPIHQWCNQNGLPYAAGTIMTYVMGTSTPKATFLDPGLTAMNTNPVVLDSAGRATLFGDGDFRLVLHDALGNEIFDVPASSLASAAMAPVVDAPTIDDALDLLGIPALIEVETDRAEAAEGLLQTHIDTTNTNLANAEIALSAAITAETTRAEAEEAHLQSEIDALAGAGPSALFSAVHDVTSSRAVGIVYTNSTGKPMFISMTWEIPGGLATGEPDTVALVVGTVTVAEFSYVTTGDSGAATGGNLSAMVPAGSAYQFTTALSLIQLWVETW